MRKVIPVEAATLNSSLTLSVRSPNGGPPSPRDPGGPPSSPGAGKTLTLGPAGSVTLPSTDVAVYGETLELLDDTVSHVAQMSNAEAKRLAISFMKGEWTGWAPFSQGWAFRRPAYETIAADIAGYFQSARPRDNPVFIVHGPAALGKSVMARQLAYDLHVRHHVTVIRTKETWRSRPDLTLLDRLCDDIEQRLPEGVDLPPIALIIDEAELLDHSVPFRAAAYLRARGRTVVPILFARTNEYFRLEKGGVQESGRANREWRLNDTIDGDEVDKLIKHLRHIGLWDTGLITESGFWQYHVEKELGSAFFDTLYSLIQPTQEPLRERVWSEFTNLGELAKRSYTLIAAVHQFGLPLKMEVLSRAIDVDYSTFEQEIIRGDAREVLFTEFQSSELNLYFRSRTRLISQLIFEQALPGMLISCGRFGESWRRRIRMTCSGSTNWTQLRTLLIQVLGPRGLDNRFADDELAELFEATTGQVQDDVLEHHFGLVEQEAGRLLSAPRAPREGADSKCCTAVRSRNL